MKIQLTSDYLRNLIRTIVPGGLGSIIAYVIQRWFPHLWPWWSSHVTLGWYAMLTVATTSVYYGAFRWLEKRFKWASAFLGAKPVVAAPVTPPVSVIAAPAAGTPTA